MNIPLIISFYTKDTIYEKEIEDLKASLEVLKLPYYIEGRLDLGSWEKNCCQKPLFILECLKKFQKPLLWVDADAMIFQKPPFLFGDVDLAIYFEDVHLKQVRTGTIYLAPTQQTLELITLWHETCQSKIERSEPLPFPDQHIFSTLLQTASLRVGSLPLEYTQIFDKEPIPLEKACIVHFQSSRTALMPPLFWRHLSGKELKILRMQVSGHALQTF